MYDDEFRPRRRGAALPLTVIAVSLVVAATALSFLAYAKAKGQSDEVRALHSEVVDLSGRVKRLSRGSATIEGRLGATEKRLRQKDAGIAPLAARVLRSVFRVETDTGWFGAGFAAWTSRGQTYLLTADHVIAHETGSDVTLQRKGGSWAGEIVRRDPKNDLALIRVDGHPAGAAPLWQGARQRAEPRTGDQLLLVGSPFGLDGTVTTGIVSRVSRKVIQTDAAANPGNSGGPALDKHGRIVGVLVAGGGENINFAVPIARACEKLRDC